MSTNALSPSAWSVPPEIATALSPSACSVPLVLVLRGVDGMPAVTLRDRYTLWPHSFSVTGLPPRLDLLVLVLRGADGMPSVTLRDRDTLWPDSFSATSVPPRLDLLVLVLRGVDDIPAVTLRDRGTLWPDSFSAKGSRWDRRLLPRGSRRGQPPIRLRAATGETRGTTFRPPHPRP
jgi:hypothetical protein